MKNKALLFSRIGLILYLICVAVLCLARFDNIQEVASETLLGLPADKVVHFLMFFPFPILTYLSFRNLSRKVWHSLVFCLSVFAAGCFLGALSEVAQGLTDYRSSDPLDFRVDCISVAISSLLVLIIDLSRQFKK